MPTNSPSWAFLLDAATVIVDLERIAWTSHDLFEGFPNFQEQRPLVDDERKREHCQVIESVLSNVVRDANRSTPSKSDERFLDVTFPVTMDRVPFALLSWSLTDNVVPSFVICRLHEGNSCRHLYATNAFYDGANKCKGNNVSIPALSQRWD